MITTCDYCKSPVDVGKVSCDIPTFCSEVCALSFAMKTATKMVSIQELAEPLTNLVQENILLRAKLNLIRVCCRGLLVSIHNSFLHEGSFEECGKESCGAAKDLLRIVES